MTIRTGGKIVKLDEQKLGKLGLDDKIGGSAKERHYKFTLGAYGVAWDPSMTYREYLGACAQGRARKSFDFARGQEALKAPVVVKAKAPKAVKAPSELETLRAELAAAQAKIERLTDAPRVSKTVKAAPVMNGAPKSTVDLLARIAGALGVL